MATASKRWQDIDNDREKYAAYLCSREWGVLKEAVRERSGGICERCKVLPQDATHHLTYERKYNERTEDLQAICTPCHEFTHGKESFDPMQNAEFMSFLLRWGKPYWMDETWATSWLSNVFKYPELIPVIHGWVTWKVAASVRLEIDPDAELSKFCVHYRDSLDDAKKSFMGWLVRRGPTHYPPDDNLSYFLCLKFTVGAA